MKIHLITVGKVRDKHLAALNEHYEKRLRHYTNLETAHAKEGRGPDAVVKQSEAQALRALLPEHAVVVLLDERGKAMTSAELAEFLNAHMNRATKNLAFVIGGAAGLDPEFLASADLRLTLSAMTLPHEMARLVIVEQLYRAFTILRGEPYHKA